MKRQKIKVQKIQMKFVAIRKKRWWTCEIRVQTESEFMSLGEFIKKNQRFVNVFGKLLYNFMFVNVFCIYVHVSQISAVIYTLCPSQ